MLANGGFVRPVAAWSGVGLSYWIRSVQLGSGLLIGFGWGLDKCKGGRLARLVIGLG